MNINRFKLYQPNNIIASGGASILDVPFGPSWNNDPSGRSANSIYDKIITIGAGFGNTAFVRTTGDDATAMVGNVLFPFASIHAAALSLGSATGSLDIDAGVYNLTDANTPFGIKLPNSSYDIILRTGCIINYYGTYGLICWDSTSSGSLYGSGKFLATSNSFSHSGFAISVSGINSPRVIEFDQIECSSTSVNAGCINLGSSTGFGSIFRANRITPRGGIGINHTANSLWTVDRTTIVGTSSVAPAIKMLNTGSSFFQATYSTAKIQLQASTASDTILEINMSSVVGTIQFSNCSFLNFSANRNSFIKLLHSGNRDILLINSILKDNAASTYSFFSSSACGIKIIETYSTRDTNGLLTNNASSGIGFVISNGL